MLSSTETGQMTTVSKMWRKGEPEDRLLPNGRQKHFHKRLLCLLLFLPFCRILVDTIRTPGETYFEAYLFRSTPACQAHSHPRGISPTTPLHPLLFLLMCTVPKFSRRTSTMPTGCHVISFTISAEIRSFTKAAVAQMTMGKGLTSTGH